MGKGAGVAGETRGGEKGETGELQYMKTIQKWKQSMLGKTQKLEKILPFECQVLDHWKKLVRGLVIKQKIKLKYMKD